MSLRVRFVEVLRRILAHPGWRGWVLFWVLRGLVGLISPRSDVSLDNLARAYPQKSPHWYRRILNAMYDHFSWMAVEYLALIDDPSQALRWVRRVRGREFLDSLLRRGEGCVILAGHGGNWELLSAWLCQSGYPLYAAVRDPNLCDFAELMERYRRTVGLRTLRRERQGVREMFRLPREGGFLGLVADQDGGPLGVPVRFFGRWCSMPGGPASIAAVARVPVVPLSIQRVAPFVHEVTVEEPLYPLEGVSRKKQVTILSQRLSSVLEDMVRRNPDEWLWMHRRWKTKLFPSVTDV